MKSLMDNLKNDNPNLKNNNDDNTMLMKIKEQKNQMERCFIDMRREFELLCLEKFGEEEWLE